MCGHRVGGMRQDWGRGRSAEHVSQLDIEQPSVDPASRLHSWLYTFLIVTQHICRVGADPVLIFICAGVAWEVCVKIGVAGAQQSMCRSSTSSSPSLPSNETAQLALHFSNRDSAHLRGRRRSSSDIYMCGRRAGGMRHDWGRGGSAEHMSQLDMEQPRFDPASRLRSWLYTFLIVTQPI